MAASGQEPLPRDVGARQRERKEESDRRSSDGRQDPHDDTVHEGLANEPTRQELAVQLQGQRSVGNRLTVRTRTSG